MLYLPVCSLRPIKRHGLWYLDTWIEVIFGKWTLDSDKILFLKKKVFKYNLNKNDSFEDGWQHLRSRPL